MFAILLHLNPFSSGKKKWSHCLRSQLRKCWDNSFLRSDQLSSNKIKQAAECIGHFVNENLRVRLFIVFLFFFYFCLIAACKMNTGEDSVSQAHPADSFSCLHEELLPHVSDSESMNILSQVSSLYRNGIHQLSLQRVEQKTGRPLQQRQNHLYRTPCTPSVLAFTVVVLCLACWQGSQAAAPTGW